MRTLARGGSMHIPSLMGIGNTGPCRVGASDRLIGSADWTSWWNAGFRLVLAEDVQALARESEDEATNHDRAVYNLPE